MDMKVESLIPTPLKDRWKPTLGDSKAELSKVLEEGGSIDPFLHDSLYTYEHMMYEFHTVWPRVREGGVLVCDDANVTLEDFTKEFRQSPKRILTGKFLKTTILGAIKKEDKIH